MKTDCLVLDLETTGFSPKENEVIAIGAVQVMEDYSFGSTFECYLRPERLQTWSRRAEEVHGINKHFAMSFPKRKKGLRDYMLWHKEVGIPFPAKLVYQGKNNFEYKHFKSLFLKELLHNSFEKAFREDYTESTRDLFAKYVKLDSYTLDSIANYLGFKFQHHKVMDDALTAAKIYQYVKTVLEPNGDGFKSALDGAVKGAGSES